MLPEDDLCYVVRAGKEKFGASEPCSTHLDIVSVLRLGGEEVLRSSFQGSGVGLQSDVLLFTFLVYRIPDEMPSRMLVAEVTTTDLRKTRYQIESTCDISKT
jgi:hypothetical protein